jgi:hypothetical protein
MDKLWKISIARTVPETDTHAYASYLDARRGFYCFGDIDEDNEWTSFRDGCFAAYNLLTSSDVN